MLHDVGHSQTTHRHHQGVCGSGSMKPPNRNQKPSAVAPMVTPICRLGVTHTMTMPRYAMVRHERKRTSQ